MTKRSSQKDLHFGVVFPKGVVERIENAKGPYYSRNRFIMKIVEEYLNENEKQIAVPQGASKVGSPWKRQAAPEADAPSSPIGDSTPNG